MDKNISADVQSAALERAGLNAANDTNGILQTLVTDSLRYTREKDVAYNNSRRSLVVRECLESRKRQFLQTECYPHVNLTFEATSGNPHGLAAARKAIEQELMINKCNRFAPVVDVGGNFYHWLHTGRSNVHSCCPIISVRDAKRLTDRVFSANKWIDNIFNQYAEASEPKEKNRLKVKKENAEHFREFTGDYYCTNLAQDCSYKSEVVLFGDSLYDIMVNDVALIMDSHSASRGFGYITFDPEMLYSTEGFIQGMDCHWRVEEAQHNAVFAGLVMKKYSRKVVRFTFDGDSNFEYLHDYDNLVRLATQEVFKGVGSTYVAERSYNNGVLRLDITKVPNTSAPSRLSFSLWRQAVKGKSAVVLYDYDGIGTSTKGRDIKWEVALVDTNLVEKVVNYGLRLDGETKFTPAAMFSYAAAVNVRGTINGVEISVSKGEDTITAYRLCYSLWFLCFLEKYKMANVMDFLVKRELRLRTIKNMGTICTLFTHFLQLPVTKLFSDESYFRTRLNDYKNSIAKVERSRWDVPNPSVSIPPPLMRFEELVDRVSDGFEPSYVDLGDLQSFVDSFAREVEPEAVRRALDDVARALRNTEKTSPEWGRLDAALSALMRRLAFLDPDSIDELERSWSFSEDAERILDTRVELGGGTLGSVTGLSNRASPTPSESASNVRSTVFFQSDGGTLQETVSGVDGLFTEGPPRVKLPGISGGASHHLLLKGQPGKAFLDIYNRIITEGISHFYVPGTNNLCAVYALAKALPEVGVNLTDEEIFTGLVRASQGLRSDWFELADITVFLDGIGVSLLCIVFSSTHAMIHTYGNGVNTVFISHVHGNHWQTFSVGGPVQFVPEARVETLASSDAFLDYVGDFSDVQSLRSYTTDVSDSRSVPESFYTAPLVPENSEKKKTKSSRAKSRRQFTNPCAKLSPVRRSVEVVQLQSTGVSTGVDKGAARASLSSVVPTANCPKKNQSKLLVRRLALLIAAFSPAAVYWSVDSGALFSLAKGFVALVAKAAVVAAKVSVHLVTAQGLMVTFPLVAVFSSPLWLPAFETAVDRHGFAKALAALPIVFVKSHARLMGATLMLPFTITRMFFKGLLTVWRVASEVDDTVLIKGGSAPDVLAGPGTVHGDTALDNSRSNRFADGRMTTAARIEEILRGVRGDTANAKKFVERVLDRGGRPTVKPVKLRENPKREPEHPVVGVRPVNVESSASDGPKLMSLGKVDAKRIAEDRTKWYISYLDYLSKSVDAYTAYCKDIYADYKDKGEVDFYKRDKRRHQNTNGAIVIVAQEPGKFRLPDGYSLPKDARLSSVFVPKGKSSGELVPAKLNVQERIIYTSGAEEEIFLMAGMFEFMDKLTYDMVIRKKITEIEPRREFRLVDGVPGCAKSTEITDIARTGDIVAVASNGAANELMEKFLAKGKDPAMVRTIGSRIIGRPEKGNRLLVDEGLKVHPGELVLLAEVVGASQVLVFGDTNQLEFKSRVPGYALPVIPMHWSVEYRTNSYTVCRDIAVALGRLDPKAKGPQMDGKGIYPHGFTTSNKIERSASYLQISSEADIPKIEGAKYVTWTQNSKDRLTKRGFKNVNTIDEFQGGRADTVVLTRLERNLEPGLRFDKGQMVVALTRHRERLIYASVEQPPALEDNVKTMIDRIAKVDDINRAYGAFSGDITLKA